MEDKKNLRVVENPVVIERYDKLKTVGKDIFSSNEISDDTVISPDHARLARKFIVEGAKVVNPEVLASYWEHVIIAPELGRRIAEKVEDTGLDVNPNEIEFTLWLHDIGRLVTPDAFFRNDLIADRLLKEVGLPKRIISNIPDSGRMLILADEMNLDSDQKDFKKPLDEEQEKQVQEYFNSLTPTQRIVNFGDNFGKRDQNGLFNAASLLAYVKSQEGRYEHESQWVSVNFAIPRRPAEAVVAGEVLKKTIKWLEDLGVDVNVTLDGLKDYGPKFVLLTRHGEIENPTNVVYNRDSIMDKKDIVHLSGKGINQMYNLGDLINSKKFKPVRIFVSPETRAQESVSELNTKLHVKNIETTSGIDEIYAPGMYRERLAMDEFLKDKSQAYYKNRWGKYHHETADKVVLRMKFEFDVLADSLSVGETGIMLSHGDPIAFLSSFLNESVIPDPEKFDATTYPEKGKGFVVVIGPGNQIFTRYMLNENSKTS